MFLSLLLPPRRRFQKCCAALPLRIPTFPTRSIRLLFGSFRVFLFCFTLAEFNVEDTERFCAWFSDLRVVNEDVALENAGLSLLPPTLLAVVRVFFNVFGPTVTMLDLIVVGRLGADDGCVDGAPSFKSRVALMFVFFMTDVYHRR